MGMVSAYELAGRVDFLLTGSLLNDLGLLRARDLAYVWGAAQEVASGGVRGCVGGRIEQGYGDGWILASGSGSSHTTLGLYRIRVSATAAYDPVTGLTLGVELEQVASIAPDELDPAAVAFWDEAKGLVYDSSDDGVIFQVRTTNGAEVQAACWAPPSHSTTTGSTSTRRPEQRGPKPVSMRCKRAWRSWRDGRKGQPNHWRGFAAIYVMCAYQSTDVGTACIGDI